MKSAGVKEFITIIENIKTCESLCHKEMIRVICSESANADSDVDDAEAIISHQTNRKDTNAAHILQMYL